MPWTASGGFTTGTPWFGYAAGLSTDNVASETSNPSSLLSYYRNWIATRKESPALLRGDLGIVETNSQVLAFTRHASNERVLAVHNVSNAAVTVPLAVNAASFERVYADAGVGDPSGGSITMPAHTSGVWRLR